MKKRIIALLIVVAMLILPIPLEQQTAMAADTTYVYLNPALHSPFNNGEFQGWGTSLCWWANRVGYNDNLTEQAARLFFTDEGLGLDIGRYNIGGGDDPTHNHIRRSDSAVPGMWKDWWYTNGGSDVEMTYDITKDYRQLNVAKTIKRVNPDVYFEGFSNSAPYFMTWSGCVGGNDKPDGTNLKDDMYDDFASYIAHGTQLLRNEGINIQSYSPINEPDGYGYWMSWNDKQEGSYMAAEYRPKMVSETRKALDSLGLNDVLVSGFDCSVLDNTVRDMKLMKDRYPQGATDLGRIDAHSYGGSQRFELRTLAEDMHKDLWMSEVDGAEVISDTAMGNSLWLANRIITDMNQMQPAAWCIWDIVDIHKDSNFINCYGETSEKWNGFDPNGTLWGVGMFNHDGEWIELSQKYYAFGQFTRYIHPGDTIIASSDASLAAYNKTSGDIKIVAYNADNYEKPYMFDLSGFTNPGDTVTTIRTNGDFYYGEHWAEIGGTTISGNMVYATLAPYSITTYVIHGKGANDAVPVPDGQYRIRLAGTNQYLSTESLDYAARACLSTTPAVFDIHTEYNGYQSIGRWNGSSLMKLDNWNNSRGDGADIRLATSEYAPARDWSISRNADGTFNITSSNCMNNMTRSGSGVYTYRYPNAVDSHWILEPILPLTDGVYALKSAKDTSFCATIGSYPGMTASDNSKAVRFAVSVCEDGNYLLRNLANNKYLTAPWDGYYLESSNLLYGYDQLRQRWSVSVLDNGNWVLTNAYSGKVLDVDAGTVRQDQALGHWDRTEGAEHQQWILQPMDSLTDGVYTISAADGRLWTGSSYLWLSDAGAADQTFMVRHMEDGTYVISAPAQESYLSMYLADPPEGNDVPFRAGLYPENPAEHSNDQWYVIPNADGTYSIVNRSNGNYLGINGDQLQCQLPGADFQSWTFNAVPAVNDGVYQFAAYNRNTSVLEVTNGSHLMNNTHANGQKFALETHDNGFCSIRDISNNLYLKVSGYNNDAALNLEQGYDERAAFRILPYADGTCGIVSAFSNQYIDLDCGATNDGRTIHTWQTTFAGYSQKWYLLPDTIGLEGEWEIAAGSDNGYVLELQAGNVVIHSETGKPSQKFRLRIENGYYLIENTAANQRLNVSDNSYADGANLIPYASGDGDNERWSIIPHADGTVSFVSKASGMYIDLNDNRLADGTNVQLWHVTAGLNAAKKWKLVTHTHRPVLTDAHDSTCSEPGYTGDMVCVCGEITQKGSTIPAKPHVYENYVCIHCGATDPDYAAIADRLRIRSVSISIRSDLAMNYYVSNSTLAGIENPYVIFTKTIYDKDGNETGVKVEEVSVYSEKSNCHVYAFRGIAAREMNSRITAQVCGTVNGQLCKGQPFVFSVREYAMKQLNNDADIALQTLLVNMLNYGAAAQSYIGYNTPNPVNAGLTDEQRDLVEVKPVEYVKDTKVTRRSSVSIRYMNAAVSLRDRVTIKPYFDLSAYPGKISDLVMVITWEGKELVIDGNDLEYAGDGLYTYSFHELTAAQMRTVCTFELRTAENKLIASDTLRYSIVSYAYAVWNTASIDEGLRNLTECMMRYGDAAEDFLIG